ncbi:ABC transporter ATP-binding protein [Shouchella clausii]|uniref:ABC transporter ATP-binding protein n=1 Tax=Shouchella clausii TaxID=79880 RepID=UPI000B95D14F|nr:ABC transporter ATP-binding protein [Shouchella clausii]AST96115.1 glutathione ABC transporter ATP-binding protein [Shouchella clausii]MCR1289489.1 ABC transporter ATP-binding protein [Shouchella clausii]MEB5473696.1 ABC transporter ATP-binding protein [Shouchella clausii]MEB5479262.1 ABC transporter ATP-binding protein [Shouchella clausii]PAD14713.1 glutathione ABC transporter ATP-binding protein [Shouchella clausii]
MPSLLDIQHLDVAFENKNRRLPVLNDVSLSINKGETVCLVGESGSGKTVTSKAIMRLIDYEQGIITGGHIYFNNQNIAELTPKELRDLRGNKIAMVFQEPMSAFDPVYTIGFQIAETILRHKRMSKQKAWEQGIRLLEKVGIPEPALRMKQYPGEMSGGMLQRTMIAMALSCEPELLIVDEPTTALDVTIQAQILLLLQQLKQEFNMSILLITHDLGIAAEIADRIVVMYAGKVVEQATTVDLFATPMHPYTQGLLQSVATMEQNERTRLYSIAGAIPSLSNLPSGCLFHPRCPHATNRCRTEVPPLEQKKGREVACWHTEVLLTEQKSSPLEVIPEVSTQVANASINKNELLFQLKNVSKHYRVNGPMFFQSSKRIRAVDNISFSIRKGETFGLVGESGSGKSTLGRMLLQLENATEGEVMFQNEDLTKFKSAKLRAVRQNMQMISQDPYGSLDPRWTIADIISEPLRTHQKLSKKQRQQRVEHLLSAVGLDPACAARHPHEFSGGQRQRIGIARAIALEPSFILADEAVSALDVSVQAQIVNLLRDLQKQYGLTYLFIAHGLNVVRYISDRIGVMYLGEMVEIGPSEEIFNAPAHPYTKALIASNPKLEPTQKRVHAAIDGEIPSPINPPAGCRFHTRCPYADRKCRTEHPSLLPLGEDHFVACHYPL